MLGPDNVLIADEKGKIERIVNIKDAGENIQQLDGILTPGFINCHCHLELSHMKGLVPTQTGLVDFIFKVVNERHFPEEEILDAIAKAEDEMLTNGIVAVGDICNNILTIPQKQLQRLAYYNFIEVSGWIPSVAQVRFERSLGYYHSFKQLQTPNPKPQTIIMWDVLSGDFDPNQTPGACLAYVLYHTKPGSIILFHDSAKAWERMRYALPKVLEHFTKEGYEFCAIPQGE